MTDLIRCAIADGIATLTLDDPNALVNTMSPKWVDEMNQIIDVLAADESVTGIIIESAKSGFMAGADLKFILENIESMAVLDAFAFSQGASRLLRKIETCGKPVVAAITGFALGGGYELALACTYRIIADNPKAVVGLPEVDLGLLPGAGGTQRLPRLIGVPAATDMMLEGKSYAPAAALKMGLVDAVVPVEQVLETARAWLATAPNPQRAWDVKGFNLPESEGLLTYRNAAFFSAATAKLRARYGDNYPAPIAILTCIFEGVQVPMDKGLLVEGRHFARLLTAPVARNIIRTMFINKSLAEKGARRPAGVEKTTVRRIGVLGAGMMGAAIAFVAARAGIDVVLLDVSREAAKKGRRYSVKLLAKSVDRGHLTQEQADAVLARITPTDDYADLAGVDLVIENVFEDTSIKGEVTRKAAAVVGDTALFASNTSSLPITQLAEAFPRQEDFIGLHFFSPVDRMALVEVILGKKTGTAALARALDFIAQIRKTPIVVNDSRGFYTSRVFLSFVHEGAEMLREGISPALIENAAQLGGMPVGPLAVTDEITLQLPIKIVRQTESEDPAFRRPASMEVLETMAEQHGRTGRKGGAGFYDYPEGGKKRLWRDLAKYFPPKADQPAADEVRKRLLYRQALESARCLEEKVLTHPADADIGAVLGWGFPTWTGGTLSLIETVGVPKFVAECDRLASLYGARFTPTVGLRAMADAGRGFDWS
jgi:3-hydroxyacyl-CoA dehydrogenase/enoyl-CoA hydratase/3-hydroxybutyryl-CoA epimerase